jgi:hypothetical protein
MASSEILVKRFVLRLKLRKQLGDAVQNCASFLKYELNKEGKIVQGFAQVNGTNEKLQYYWVEDVEGKVYDVCYEVALLNNPVVEKLKYTLVRESWSEDKFDKDDHAQEMFKLYRDEPSKFWKSVPRLNF